MPRDVDGGKPRGRVDVASPGEYVVPKNERCGYEGSIVCVERALPVRRGGIELGLERRRGCGSSRIDRHERALVRS
jgi:hypothetical protein